MLLSQSLSKKITNVNKLDKVIHRGESLDPQHISHAAKSHGATSGLITLIKEVMYILKYTNPSPGDARRGKGSDDCALLRRGSIGPKATGAFGASVGAWEKI
jgi:hypothetical protein